MNTDIIRLKQAGGPLKGEITIPGDKSISHRSVMFGALSEGKTRIRNFLTGADCLSTLSCFEKMGIRSQTQGDELIIEGKGLYGLKDPVDTLYTGNSGTTTRLISGILAGQSFSSRLTGDASIEKRPMKRVIDPLTLMGAKIRSEKGNGCAPLCIEPAPLRGIEYHSPVASAQVKSALLLAGLYAEGNTTVVEPVLSRNHTELMLEMFGGTVESEGTRATVTPAPVLRGCDILVPGDISSAAYFIAAALIVPGSEVLIKNVGINPTRAGILEVAKMMGGDITLENEKSGPGEPCADLLVRSSSLKGCVIGGDLIPTLIDELPVIAVMAAFASGTTHIKDAAELKVKESDRIMSISENLKKMGADVIPTEDGMFIEGGKALHGTVIDPYLDHRIAMSFAVASLMADGETTIENKSCVDISYPTFYNDLASLRQ
ncbi:MAG: 3-phosphoshikimate 1-carboxyvinyltransferase [Lachnospiraceae bacterium]|nr:3-phosphoshikimate 1-carboxyvinyltransferase [Lachnospiraceae bacterium]